MEYIIATQAVGIFAMIVAILSFQATKNSKILIYQIIASTLWFIHFTMLGVYLGALLNALALARNIVFYFKNQKWAKSIIWFFLFTALTILIGVLTWEGTISILPVLGMLLSTISLYMNDPNKLRVIYLASSPLWLVYDLLNSSIAGVLTECFVMCSIIIALIRFSNKNTDKK